MERIRRLFLHSCYFSWVNKFPRLDNRTASVTVHSVRILPCPVSLEMKKKTAELLGYRMSCHVQLEDRALPLSKYVFWINHVRVNPLVLFRLFALPAWCLFSSYVMNCIVASQYHNDENYIHKFLKRFKWPRILSFMA